jgi:hypothetical protein
MLGWQPLKTPFQSQKKIPVQVHGGRVADTFAEQHARQSTVRGPDVTHPEIYFGELANTYGYVKTGKAKAKSKGNSRSLRG